MKRIALFFALLSAVVSCSGTKSKIVTVHDVIVDGWINYDGNAEYEPSECFEIPDGRYEFVVDNNNTLSITIDIKTIKNMPNLTIDSIDEFRLCIGDSEPKSILNSNGEEIGLKLNNAEVLEKLFSSKIGDINELSFHYVMSEKDKNILKQIEIFRIWMDVNISDKQNMKLFNSAKSSNSSNSKWDDVLDEYEKYVDNYIRLYKSAMAGNVSALSEYADMMEQAETYADKLENAQGNMTQAQISRYLRITEKMSNALIDL